MSFLVACHAYQGDVYEKKRLQEIRRRFRMTMPLPSAIRNLASYETIKNNNKTPADGTCKKKISAEI